MEGRLQSSAVDGKRAEARSHEMLCTQARMQPAAKRQQQTHKADKRVHA